MEAHGVATPEEFSRADPPFDAGASSTYAAEPGRMHQAYSEGSSWYARRPVSTAQAIMAYEKRSQASGWRRRAAESPVISSGAM